MKIIRTFRRYCEAISGTELMGPVGPNYGDMILPNTITNSDTGVIFSDIDAKFYTTDEYDELYGEYLKNGGNPINDPVFNKGNLEEVLAFLRGE